MKAIIFCGGDVSDYGFYNPEDFKGAYILCADGGLRHAKRMGVTPDLVIGDMDSCNAADGVKCKCFPPEKDFTDTNLCIDNAVEQGCDEIVLIGALGGRRDHEFSHLCLLAYGLKRGVRIVISDKYNEIRMADKPFKLKRGSRKYVSFFPFGGRVEGLTIRGLKYETDNMCLEADEVRASSNEFTERCGEAEVSFTSGRLVVMLCDDRESEEL